MFFPSSSSALNALLLNLPQYHLVIFLYLDPYLTCVDGVESFEGATTMAVGTAAATAATVAILVSISFSHNFLRVNVRSLSCLRFEISSKHLERL